MPVKASALTLKPKKRRPTRRQKAIVASPKDRSQKHRGHEASPFRLMAQIMSQQLAALSRNLRPLGISGPMSRILTGLSEAGDATIGDLAEHSGFERSYVSRLLDQLTAIGLTQRVADPVDRRQRLVRLTPKGFERQRQAAAIVAKLSVGHLTGLSAREVAQLRGLLARIARSYQAPPQ